MNPVQVVAQNGSIGSFPLIQRSCSTPTYHSLSLHLLLQSRPVFGQTRACRMFPCPIMIIHVVQIGHRAHQATWYADALGTKRRYGDHGTMFTMVREATIGLVGEGIVKKSIVRQGE